MLDAYTIRRAIPRLIVAVIAINLSIYLCVAALDITTIVGKGMHQLLVTPFLQDTSINGVKLKDSVENNIVGVVAIPSILAGLVAGAFAIAGGAALAILGFLLPLLITIVFITLAVLFTLIIRQGLLIFLTIISPVAIACNILPGTEKYFKQWQDVFIKTLMVYPIIAAIFAMSNVLAAILLKSDVASVAASVIHNPYQFAQAANNDGLGLIQLLVVIIVLYAPLFMIPFAFKLAGGAIAQIAGLAGSRFGGLGGGINKRISDAKNNPDSMFGEAAQRRASNRVERGLTGRQIWAKRPGGGANRAGRIRSAQSFDRKFAEAKAAETFKAKQGAADSDVQDSLLLTNAQAQAAREKLRTTMQQDRAAYESGNLSQREFNDRNRMHQRQLDAHDMADMVGRSEANRRNAFFNADRIKYSSKTYKEEMQTAMDIFGEDQFAEAGSKFQAIAAGPAGRSDLSGNLYGQSLDPKRTATKNSASTVLQGHPNGVKGVIDQQMSVLNDQTGSYTMQEKEAAVQMLTSLQSNASSPYGAGSEGSKLAVKQKAAEIEQAYKSFATDQNTMGSSYHQLKPDGTIKPELVGEGYEVSTTDPATGQTITQQKQTEKTGSDAVLQRIKNAAGQAPDKTQLQTQQQDQANQNQGDGDN